MKKIVAILVVAISVALAAASVKQPPRKWEIYLIAQTHVDIGYTDSQDAAMRKQWNNLEAAMRIIDGTKDMPEGAKFRWNPEVTWAIQTWLDQADVAQREKFIRLVKDGSIGIGAFYGNMLTELCRPEELMKSLSYKRELERMTGTVIDSAMITDVPGWTWGLTTALSNNGIKYLSLGTNRRARLGFTLSDWADRPFYWVSPSGKNKVLCFIHGKGYSWFHSPLALIVEDIKLRNKFTPSRIYRYLKQLEADGYPYDIIPIRYAVGSDNGPPDPRISGIVAEWNIEHPDVHVRISTVSETFREFEARYGDKLPNYAGDFSPYWSDGAASTARETAMTRNASETLAQAGTLWAIMRPKSFPAAVFSNAWKQILLFNEHTWGAYNSIISPDSRFAASQWQWKQRRAVEASQQAVALIGMLLDAKDAGVAADGSRYIEVINTNSWRVTGPARIVAPGLDGVVVATAEGTPVASQLLHDGSLYFLADDVKGLSSKKYSINKGEGIATGRCRADEHGLSNGKFAVSFDPAAGTISGIRNVAAGVEFVNNNFADKFNEYIYIHGRSPKHGRVKIAPEPSFAVKESGPLLCSVEIGRKVMNSNSLTTTVTMYDGLDRIDIVNELDRPSIRSKEGIHFAFPFAAANPAVRYDVAWGSVQVDMDQMKGSCKNYMTPLRWVDVSGDASGAQIVLRDAPLFEAGDITNDPKHYGWLRETRHNGVIYSYVMNNYWETNYKADQPGITSFRYAIFPHAEYNVALNTKRGMEVMRPLLISGVDGSSETMAPPVVIDNENIIVESIEALPPGEGLLLFLYNISSENQAAVITLDGECGEMFMLDDSRNQTPMTGNRLDFGKHEAILVICK